MSSMLLNILVGEIARTYKQANQAFTAYDFTGTNYVTVEDFLNAKVNYRLPFTRDELRFMLVNETVFKRYDKIDIDQFVKNFFPDPSAANEKRDASKSSDDE